MVLVLPIYAALVNLMLLLCKRQQINVQRTITHEKVVQVPVESLYLVQGNQLVSSTIDTSNTLTICLFLFFLLSQLESLFSSPIYVKPHRPSVSSLHGTSGGGERKLSNEVFELVDSSARRGYTVVVSTENLTSCHYYTLTHFNHYWYVY